MTKKEVSLLRAHHSVRITGPEVTVLGIDVVDETPLLDIEPFVPDFDVPDDADTGWLDASKSTIKSKQADKRFL